VLSLSLGDTGAGGREEEDCEVVENCFCSGEGERGAVEDVVADPPGGLIQAMSGRDDAPPHWSWVIVAEGVVALMDLGSFSVPNEVLIGMDGVSVLGGGRSGTAGRAWCGSSYQLESRRSNTTAKVGHLLYPPIAGTYTAS